MRRAAILATLVATLATAADGAGMQRTFAIPKAATGEGGLALEVHVGPLTAGQRVRVTTADGQLIGAVAPFGAAARRTAGVYSLPVPPSLVRGDVLDTRLTIEQADQAPRAPTAAEVTSVELRPVPQP